MSLPIMRRPLDGRRLPAVALALLPLALVACSKGGPVGEGIAPVSLTLLAGDSNTLATAPGAVRVFQCFTGSLAAALRFSDGSAGNYTNRVQWSSSEPDVIAVSNAQAGAPQLGDIPKFDGSGYYAPGTLVVKGAGSATIRADFSSLHQEISVSVAQPAAVAGKASPFAIKAVLDSMAVPVGGYTMGIGTTQQFRALATVDGMERNVSDFTEWRVGNASIGSTDATGLLTARGRGDTMYTAHLALCDQDVSIPLHVADISSIESKLEFGADPLIVGNREYVHVLATLDDGSGPQDVSAQAVLTSGTPSIVTIYGGTGGNLLVPVVDGTGTIQATLLNLYTAPDITVTTLTAGLTDLAIQPPGVGLPAGSNRPTGSAIDGRCASDIVRAGSAETCAYTALGTFDNGQVQDVTRMVTWAILDKTLGAISSTPPTAGLVTAGVATAVGQTQITATPPNTSSVLPVARTITFDSASNPATPPP